MAPHSSPTPKKGCIQLQNHFTTLAAVAVSTDEYYHTIILRFNLGAVAVRLMNAMVQQFCASSIWVSLFVSRYSPLIDNLQHLVRLVADRLLHNLNRRHLHLLRLLGDITLLVLLNNNLFILFLETTSLQEHLQQSL
jgi:hypothetical protein